MKRMMMTDHKRLTNPFSFFAAMIVYGVAVLAVVTLGIGIFKLPGGEIAPITFYGFGDAGVCVSGVDAGLPAGDREIDAIGALTSGVTPYVTEIKVCSDRPTIPQRVLVTLATLPVHVVYAGLLVGLWRITYRARRTGVFDPMVGRRLGRLGKAVAWSAIPAVLIGEVARLQFIEIVKSDIFPFGDDSLGTRALSILFFGKFPFGTLLTGLALITLGRIFLYGSRLEEVVGSSSASSDGNEASTPTT
ncbi:DUF2975 domain-containing protein [Streptosporangium roseum]|uniref:Uncharacterized protein n=1 Tax=Streptosporangium roseum (strain ATCC 12428 / DSM 43021 / JCM 3005 / KCTC 9067 / NCIMB 10171 / NRRL 2505 / NI 9100) TaxID=479432 RepID=D2B9Y2_STRRD|nr:DUF2975 domain-containing protein [Streptosporangium roseum]ACZ85995.1 hypothetical protein Sros_3043 [Streptosporangium roseum DSM 43021]